MRAAFYFVIFFLLVLANARAGDLKGFDINKLTSGLGEVKSILESPEGCTTDPSTESSLGLCKDLYSFTCAPGDYYDGTGSASTSGAMQNKVSKLRQDSNPYFTREFQNAIKKPDNEYFRKLALSAFGLTYSPACTLGGDKLECDRLVSRGLTDLAMNRIFPSPTAGVFYNGAMTQPRNISDLDLLIQNPAYQEVEQELGRKTRNQLQDQKMTDKIRTEIFPEVRKMLVDLVQNTVEEPQTRKNLMAKINAIRFEGTDCFEMTGMVMNSDSNSSISSLMIPNAFYDPRKNTFKYCNGFLLSSQSEFKIASVIAHELGHSIDPCSIANGPSDFSFKYTDPNNVKKSENEYPLADLVSCLRSEKSVGAKTPEQLLPKKKKSKKKAENLSDVDGEGIDFGAGPEGLKPVIKSPFCANDQIAESVADWIAGEILPKYLQEHYPNLSRDQYKLGYSNVFRGMCDNSNPMASPYFPHDVHPDYEKRVNKIILANPRIRQQMGCPAQTDPETTYCSVGKGSVGK